MATRRLGLGTVISVDKDNDSGNDTISLVINAKPPTREREQIDNTTLEDTLQTNDPGIEKHSQYSFRIKVDKADAVHAAILTTLFDNKTTTTWVIVFTDGTNETWTFDGWIQKLEHQPVEYNKHNELEVTVDRTTAITVS